MTHYIPFFTTRRHGLQRAACGEPVDRRQHSCEPECPECAAWLAADAVETNQTAKALEAEYPEFAGKLGVTP